MPVNSLKTAKTSRGFPTYIQATPDLWRLNLFNGEYLAMNPSILEKYNALPTGIKKQVEDFIEFLAQKYLKNSQPPVLPTEKKYGYGSLAGKLVVPDDFDEPLEEIGGVYVNVLA
ncbi:Protein of unknown function [Picosynechococcus sp. OG1]|nr:Protein of unknown function [Picosynechococcus sp. OG1]